MKRGKPVVLFVSAVLLLLAGCHAEPSVSGPIDRDATVTDKTIESIAPTSEPSPRLAPTETEVLEMREQVLRGMSEEEIHRLSNIIVKSNDWWERVYLYDNIFGLLSDPRSPTWNYFHETGDIQIGWSYNASLDKDAICADEGLTEWEFYKKYGTGVNTYNEYDADGFIALLQEASASVEDAGFLQDLQYIMDQTRLAKETHDMEHANNLYKSLHDMDYFCSNTGPKTLARMYPMIAL